MTYPLERCPRCGGSGYFVMRPDNTMPFGKVWRCESCKGRGVADTLDALLYEIGL